MSKLPQPFTDQIDLIRRECRRFIRQSLDGYRNVNGYTNLHLLQRDSEGYSAVDADDVRRITDPDNKYLKRWLKLPTISTYTRTSAKEEPGNLFVPRIVVLYMNEDNTKIQCTVYYPDVDHFQTSKSLYDMLGGGIETHMALCDAIARSLDKV